MGKTIINMTRATILEKSIDNKLQPALVFTMK